MATVTLPKIDYLSRYYDALKADLLSIIKTVFPTWEATDETDFGVMLADLFSYVGDILQFYLDRNLNEVYLQTVTQRENLIGLLELINYSLHPPTAATVEVTVRCSDHVSPIVISQSHKVLTALGLIFEASESTVIPAGTNQAVLTFIQGQTLLNETLGTSTGLPNQIFNLTQSPYISDSEIIKVNGVTWTQVNTFAYSSGSDMVYRVIMDFNGNAQIAFGDGIYGAIPPIGVTILAYQYRIGGGIVGNIPKNAIRSLSPSVSGVISVTNLVEGSGGQDLETVDEAKVNGPASLQALGRAVTLEDFKNLSISYTVANAGTVAKANATVKNWYTIQVSIAPKADIAVLPTNTLKTSLQTYLQERCLAHVVVEVIDPSYIDGKVTAKLYVKDNYDLQETYLTALDKIQTAFSYESMDFGEDAFLSQAYEALQFEAVIKVDITEFCLATETNEMGNITIQDGQLFNLSSANINLTVERYS